MISEQTMGDVSKAEELKRRAYAVYGHGHITRVAEATTYPRQRVSRVLNEQETSRPMLKAIEKHLNEKQGRI